MKFKKWISLALCVAMTAVWLPDAGVSEVRAEEVQTDREVLNFNTDWLYSRVDYGNGESVNLDDSGFEKVSVPHANTFIKDHVADDFEKDIASYRFVSWYRRYFKLPESYAGRNILVEFEGVATVAEVYLNGELVGEHKGAYTGFTVDISDAVYTDGRDNVLAVRVDSQRQPQLPPEGGNVDYCLFGGIVRDVNMTITDPVYVERTFVTTPGLESGNGIVKTQVDIKNKLAQDKSYTIETTVKDKDGKTAATASKKETLTAGEETTVTVETEKITNPHLWDIDDPYLYTLVTTVKDGDTVIDTYDTAFGMRYFEFKSNSDTDRSFYLNGKKVVIVGINRHEQWPWIGRAVPDKLQEQDADLIKANGINAVRCSHYPQDPSFMDRCDEIGLLVFTEPPGWQHVGNAEWQENFKTNLEELILRDRNHPSVISWGVVPNESEARTDDVKAFNQACQKLAKELDPTRPTHGVRWEFFFDNHTVNGRLQDIATDLLTTNYRYPGFNNNKDEDLLSRFDNAYLVTEHSMECWFNGGGLPGTTDTLALQFVDSFMKYVDYFYEKDTIAGGFGWSMFDYNNEVNYTNTNHVFYSGVYDIFRHEKPLAWAYRTQQDVEDAGEMVYIANNETGKTSTTTNTVYVFSNCEEVELFVGGVSQGKITPNKYMNLPHPIFEFTNVNYAGKELKAVGYIDGQAVKEDVKAVTGEAVKLIAKPDYDTLTADGTDMTSVSVTAVDANGNAVPFASNRVNVTQKSGAETTLISEDNVALEGGKIAFLVQSVRGKTGEAEFEVTSDGLASGTCKITIGEFTADNLVPVSEGNGTEKPEFPSRYVINDSVEGDGLYQFDYQGADWESGTETTAYNGDNHWTSTKDDFCEIRFEGTAGIQYYGAKAPAHGIVAFSVDGGEETLVDCYAASRQGSVLLFDSGILGEGEHVLKARLTGDKNTAATGTYMNADRVVIYREEKGKAFRLAASYDMTKTDGKLVDTTGNGNDAAYVGFTDNDFKTEGQDTVLVFDGSKEKYVTIPAGLIETEKFAIEATFKTGTVANSWVWCLGTKEAAYPNVMNYVFVSPRFAGDVLRAGIKDAAAEQLFAGAGSIANDTYTTVRVEFEEGNMKLLVDGNEVCTMDTGYSIQDILKNGTADDICGYIGKSLYVADDAFTGTLTQFNVYVENVLSALPATYFMENVGYAGQRASIDGAGPKDPGTPVITWPNETDMQYRWAFKAVEGGYQIVNANSNLVMAAENGKITQEAADGSENQLWTLEPVNGVDNQYRIQNAASKSYLTATDTRAYGTGYEMSVAEKAEDNKQIWKLEETDTCILQAEMENGTVNPQAATVTKGDSKGFTATAAEGYEITSVMVNGNVLDEKAYKVSADGVVTFTLKDIEENQYVIVTTKKSEVIVAVKKDDLKKAIADAEKLEEAKYTADSWKKVADAIADAKRVDADTQATQEEVDAVVKELADAIDALEEKPDDPRPPITKLPYVDVEEDAWYYDAVAYNYVEKTMTGKDETHFVPTETLVRAQFAAVLHKMNETPEMEYTDLFSDVTEPDWFKDAVLWAADKKIVTGYTGTDLFGPNDSVTRSQMATMMYRYAKDYKGYDVKADGDYSSFPDAGDVQEFAKDAMKWAVTEGIITGKTINGQLLLDPQGSANRAECATIIQRFMEKYEK